MSETSPNTTPENLQSGIAVLNDAPDPFDDDPPFQVSGIAMPAGIVTRGGSGMEREWPGEALRDATEFLVGKSIVQDFHPAAAEQAPASAIIGQITDAWYDDVDGLRFDGEITDQEAAQKIDRGYLEVSLRPMIADERYDAANDRHVVESIADFLDIALVDHGAAHGNSIEIGSNAAVAALSKQWLANADQVAALRRSEARTPSYTGTRSGDSWPDGGPSLSDYAEGYYGQGDVSEPADGIPSNWGDLPSEAQDWIAAKTLLGSGDAGSSDDGISYPVVHPDGDLSEDALTSARAMAGHADGASDSIRSITNTLLENEFDHDIDANSESHSPSKTDANSQYLVDPSGAATKADAEAESTDTDAFADARVGPDDSMNPLTAALHQELELTGTTPDRCRSIKSGAKQIDTETNAIARDVLDLHKPSEAVDIKTNELAQKALGIEKGSALGDNRPPHALKSFGADIRNSDE